MDLCRALAAVHGTGTLHGDVKAHNVMRGAGGHITLTDFGTSKDLSREQRRLDGDFAGTPLYLAPEVFTGAPRTVASDVYSLGVLLFYLVTGTYPVDGATRTEVGRRHDQPGARRLLRDVRPDLPTTSFAWSNRHWPTIHKTATRARVRSRRP
jgi:serine/threonine protein kinase